MRIRRETITKELTLEREEVKKLLLLLASVHDENPNNLRLLGLMDLYNELSTVLNFNSDWQPLTHIDKYSLGDALDHIEEL